MALSASLTTTSIRMYSVFDVVAQEYGPPFLSKSNATAIRAFRTMLRQKDLAQLAGTDYKLFRIGEFDAESGIVSSYLEEVESAISNQDIEKIFGKGNVTEVKDDTTV